MDFQAAPGYLQGADLHNIGAGNPSFFSDPLEATGNAVESVGDHVVNSVPYAVSSIVSGINSIYNTGVAAGNWMGITDADKSDTQQLLGSFDTDLGKYYKANKQLVDLSGFLATSFVPGIGGIKIFNAGQKVLSGALETGSVGRTLASATGLIPTVTAEGLSLTQVAARAMAEGQQTFSFLNAGVIKAIGSGFAQNAWESAAFEAMVQATMQKSPILEDQDLKDVASNVLLGGAVGGAIGGLIHTAGVYGAIKREMNVVSAADKPFTLRASQAYLDDSPASRIIVNNSDLMGTPAAYDLRTEALTTQRVNNITNDNRQAFNQLTQRDTVLGNIVADNMQALDPDVVSKAVAGAKRILRPGSQVVAGEGETLGTITLHGDNLGGVTFDTIHPNDLNIADQVLPSSGSIDKIAGARQGVQAIVDKAASAGGWNKAGKYWDPITATSSNEIEARYIWAENQARYENGMTIGVRDIPLQEGALRSGLDHILVDDGVHTPYSVSQANLANEVRQNKAELVQKLQEAQKSGWGFNASGQVVTDLKGDVSTLTSRDIARAANVSTQSLESTLTPGVGEFARQDAQAAYDAMRKAKGISGGESNLSFIPQHAKVVYDTSALHGVNGNTVSAMVDVVTRQKIAQEAVDRAFAGVAGADTEKFVHPPANFAVQTNTFGAGPGVITYANGGYNTPASWAEWTGKATSELITRTKKNLSDILESTATKLRTDQVSAIGWDALRNKLSSTAEKYILNEAGDGLIAEKTARYEAAVKAGQKGVEVPVLQAGAPDRIPFLNQTVGEAAIAHMEASGYVTEHTNNLQAAQGLKSAKSTDTFYPYKPDPKSMPYFAFVKDESVVGQGMGHTSMIHAASERELSNMMDMVRERTGYSVYTKNDTEEFYKAQQEYQYERTLHDNYMDSSLKSNGINNQFFPKTDPTAIVNEWLGWHERRAITLARESVATKFSNEFDQLGGLGEQFMNTASSRYKTSVDAIEKTTQNPYNDYKKVALNISKLGEYPFLDAMNRTFSNTINGTIQRILDSFGDAKSVNDLQTVNDALQKAGLNSAYKNAAEVVLANHSAPPQYVGNFIRGANAILQNTILRMDFLNPVHITLASQVLLGHETPEAIRAVMRTLPETSALVPGTADRILTPLKVIAQANKNFFGATPELEQMYHYHQWDQGIRQQVKSMMEDLTLAGNETPAQLNTLLASAKEKAAAMSEIGGKITGNDWVEKYNRFISADVARQISDIGIQNGAMSAADQVPFINTFMNRTHANALASQRPLLFQGPIGQALGLFQSYQFNVMQQLFRGVSEGGAKDAAMLLGLQGTMFGLNGLPAFDFINQHIIGTASGNPNHTDAYSTLYGAAGKNVGDWLMYGVPSNILQTNVYGRGNINPRQLTVIPTNPADITAYSMFAKFAGNLKDTVGKIAGGGDVWESVLQGIEHNGISRPLSGLAQTAQALTSQNHHVFSTTNQGDISFVNDFMSLATLTRLAGGKPLDEALANDELARTQVYKASDHARMKEATQTFKTTVMGDTTGDATPAAVNNYMAAFVHNGGRQEDFNKNMLTAMTAVNTPRANKIIESLKGPYAEHMKLMMGGSVEGLDSPP